LPTIPPQPRDFLFFAPNQTLFFFLHTVLGSAQDLTLGFPPLDPTTLSPQPAWRGDFFPMEYPSSEHVSWTSLAPFPHRSFTLPPCLALFKIHGSSRQIAHEGVLLSEIRDSQCIPPTVFGKFIQPLFIFLVFDTGKGPSGKTLLR